MKVGIDLGGTKIEGIVLDARNVEFFRLRIDTETEGGYGHVVNRIAWLYRRLTESIHDKPHTLGIGTPGTISQRTGLLKNCNATVLNGHPLQDDLVRLLQRSFTIENDANCFAIAEASSGAGVGYDHVLGIVLGTGCGAGIVINGRLISGRHHVAGEWGHMSIDPNGPPCYCGRRGCVERYLSGSALQLQYAAVTGKSVTVEKIVEYARAGESHALATIDTFLDRFAFAMANVIAILDPEVVVIGGGLANVDEIYSSGIARVGALIFNDSFSTAIVKNSLGNASGVLGAAMIGV